MLADSSAFFALADNSAEQGKQIETTIAERRLPLVTTNFILAETVSLVTKRINKAKGIEVGEKILASSITRLLRLEEAVEREAWQLFKKYRDKDFDFIDATSFVVCRQRGIKEVLTLDRHFAQMGFRVFP